MSITFPTTIDSFTNPNATDPRNNPSHAGQHADINDAVEALETKVGIDNSADTDSLDYKVSQKVDKTTLGFINVQDYGAVGDGVTNDTTAFTNAITAARAAGSSLYIPGVDVDNGKYYKVDGGTINIDWTGGRIFGDGNTSKIYSATGNCVTVSAYETSVQGLALQGNRVTGTIGLYLTSAGRVTSSDLKIELFDELIKWDTIGFHNYFTNIHLRNAKTYAINIPDFDCVGALLSNITYDTDTGTYAQPTAGLRLANQGNKVSNVDFIHAGKGLLIETNGHNVEWMLFTDSYFADSGSGAGIHITAGASKYIRGINFTGGWSATNDRGILIDGSGTVDGVNFTNMLIHNSTKEGVNINCANAKNIIFNGCQIAGNNVEVNNNNGFLVTTCAGPIYIYNSYFGRSMQWVTDPLYHIYLDTNATSVFSYGCVFDANATGGTFINNGTGNSIESMSSGWTSYTPALTGITIGNGTITAAYKRNGKMVTVRVYILLGSTSSVTGTIYIDFPFTSISYPSAATWLGSIELVDASTPTYAGLFIWDSTSRVKVVCQKSDATYLTQLVANATQPFTWTSTDSMSGQFTYEIA